MLQAMRSRMQSLAGLLALYVLALSWVVYAGKDINWDQINYHLYAPHLWWHDRLAQDYYAGSIQSYLNPLSYLPFYAMVMADWNDLVIACVLATLQFGGIVAIWKLYPRLVPEAFATHKGWRFLACFLGFLSPIYLVELGNSFSENLSGMLVLFSLLYILPNQGSSIRHRALFVGGLLMGAATALKLTNGIFPIAALPLLASSRVNDQRSILKSYAAFLGGCATAFILFQGYFSWRLWQQFNNPFFPFFNNIFKSPDFLQEGIQDKMFLGKGFWGFFTLPWDLMKWRRYIYMETAAADSRLMALALLGIACALTHVWRRWQGQARNAVSVPDELILTSWFFIIGLALWAWTTHIGRYAIPLWLLLGLLLVAWLLRLLPHRQDWAVLLVVAVIGIQSLLNLCINAKRWSPFGYTGKWYELDLPAVAKTNNALFLTMQNLSPSFLVPYLPEDASFANIVNRQFVAPTGEHISPKFGKLLRHKNPIFLLTLNDTSDMEIVEGELKTRNAAIAMYGLTFKSCEIGAAHFRQHGTDTPFNYALIFCPLKRLEKAETYTAIAFANKQDAVFARIESSCPEWFSPSGIQTVNNGQIWWRDYFNTRSSIGIDQSGKVYGSAQGGPNGLYLGNVKEIMHGAVIKCPAPVTTRYGS